MRTALLAMLVATVLTVTGGAWAQEANLPQADRSAIRSTIQTQLDAFRRDDAEGAYAEAAPNIRTIFPSADIFMEMVRRGYPPVYRPRSTDFTSLRVEDGQFVQHVDIIGPDGTLHEALYTMVRGADGSWRIAGCALLVPNRVGV